MSIGRNDLRSLKAGIAEGIIDQGCVVYLGERSFEAAEEISVRPATELLRTEAAKL